MRISDWSSDVCSSDLDAEDRDHLDLVDLVGVGGGGIAGARQPGVKVLLEDGDRVRFRLAGQRRGVGGLVNFAADPHRRGRAGGGGDICIIDPARSEEHTSELQSLMRISYAVFCLKKKKQPQQSP